MASAPEAAGSGRGARSSGARGQVFHRGIDARRSVTVSDGSPEPTGVWGGAGSSCNEPVKSCAGVTSVRTH